MARDSFQNPHPLMPEIWAGHGRWRTGDVALETESGVLAWGELVERMNRIGHGLQALGLEPGARVATLMANDLAYVETLLGIMAGGFAAVPMNPGVADAALSTMLADAEVSAVMITAEHMGRLTPPPSVKPGALLCAEWTGEVVPAPWRAYETWRDAQDPAPLGRRCEPGSLCNIIYSSGTTGTPKGIVHTHGQRLVWTQDVSMALRYHGGCRTLFITGLHSNISWVGLLSTLLAGGRLVVRRGFDPEAFLPLVEAHGITNLSAVPIQYQRILEAGGFDRFHTSSLRAMMCCGSPLPEPVKRAWFELLPGKLIELYGTTEGVATTLDPEDAEGRMKSVGRPLAGADIAILGGDDRPVARGEPGEVAGRSRWMMDGYWRKPEATAEATWTDENGERWLRTGDIGRLDADGFLYVFDRKKDMILSGGQNVYPADIEEILIQHPQVAECAVIGAPHPKWGETPIAIAVLRTDAASADPEALKAWLNAKVGKFQRVSQVRFAGVLPRNAAGKVLKRELRRELFEPVGS